MNNHADPATYVEDNPIGTWVSIGHPAVVEAIAQLDLDFVLIDMEHTTMCLETVENLVRGVAAVSDDTDVVVRPPWNDPVRVKRVVDIGKAGVMVPMVETVSDAERLVRSVWYPPEGIRGIAGSRATGYGHNFEEYVGSVDGSILTIAQIETETALENAEDIASVQGIDALFVGPADLSGALGVFAEWDSDTYNEAVQQIIDVSDRVDIPVGTFTSQLGGIEDCVEKGFDFLIAGKDTEFLMEGTREAIKRYDRACEDGATVND